MVATIQSLSKSETLPPLHSDPSKTTEITKPQKSLGGRDESPGPQIHW